MIDDIERLKKDNKELQNEVDYYKHEYYCECDLREKLEKALDKACEVMTNRVNIDRGDGYPTLHFTKEEWKAWCLKDD